VTIPVSSMMRAPSVAGERPDDSPPVVEATPASGGGSLATLAATVPIAVIELAFDPYLRFGDLAVRLETLATAVAVLVALLVAARTVRVVDGGLDDILFVALGAIPGAILGGRLGYGLLHLDYYAASPTSLVDPSQGSLELGLAVVGGVLTGSWVAVLLGGRVRGWLEAAIVPLLIAIVVGKLATALGGGGQGLPSDASWATAYVGDGPWASLGASTPSHPSQLYEALGTALVLLVVIAAGRVSRLARPAGRLFFIGIGGWAVVRAAAASTWRDEPVLAGLRAGQVIALAILAGCVVLLVVTAIRSRHRATGDSVATRAPAT
jgi:prolipoprotein diacylglyceryltransferase